MTLKEICGVDENNCLNISSPLFIKLCQKLQYVTYTATARILLSNFAIVEYKDIDVWYIIATVNNFTDGICPANTKMLIPTFDSLNSALGTYSKQQATLGQEVII